MPQLTKPPNCPSPNEPAANRPAARGDEGMVLIIVMFMATLMLVALTAVLPSVYQEGQREREEETIFRGTQYGRAVALFHRQFNRYPVNVKELLQTNNMRFLRHEYTDPLDPKGKWRFIHANAAGVLIDSKNQPVGMNGLNQPGNTGSGFGQNSMGSGFGQNSMGSGFGQNSMSSGFGQSQSSSQGQGIQTTSPQFSQMSLSSSNSDNPTMGGFIVGVAPTRHRESIKVWNKHKHYDEWEFIGTDMGIFGIQVGMPNQPNFNNPPLQPGGVTPGTINPSPNSGSSAFSSPSSSTPTN